MSRSTMARLGGGAGVIATLLLTLLLCAAPCGAEPGDPAKKAEAAPSSYSGLAAPGAASEARAPAAAYPRAQDSLNYAPGYNGYAGTWRDPENGDIVTSVIAPRPQPAPQNQTPLIIEPQIAPGAGWGGQGASSGQQGGVYYVGPNKAYEIPSAPGMAPPPGWNNGPGNGWAPSPGQMPGQKPWPVRPGSAGPGQNPPGQPGNTPGNMPPGGWCGNPGSGAPSASPLPPQAPNGWLPPALGNGQGNAPGQPAPGWNSPGQNPPVRPWNRPGAGIWGNGGWSPGQQPAAWPSRPWHAGAHWRPGFGQAGHFFPGVWQGARPGGPQHAWRGR